MEIGDYNVLHLHYQPRSDGRSTCPGPGELSENGKLRKKTPHHFSRLCFNFFFDVCSQDLQEVQQETQELIRFYGRNITNLKECDREVFLLSKTFKVSQYKAND